MTGGFRLGLTSQTDVSAAYRADRICSLKTRPPHTSEPLPPMLKKGEINNINRIHYESIFKLVRTRKS